MKRRFKKSSGDRPRMQLISGRLREQRRRVVAPLRRGVFLLPVTITSIGLFAGFYGLVMALEGRYLLSALLIYVAAGCDSLDGRVARASRTSSQFGVEYDSLSDMVAFGVGPAVLLYAWALRPLGKVGIAAAGLFAVSAALRLARFNVQTATVDKRRFVGLPAPGAALMVAGLVVVYHGFGLNSPRLLCAVAAPLAVALAGLMISRVPYPSFKALPLREHARLELLVVMLLGAAMLFAMPELTAFLLATGYMLSGPFLMLGGEKLAARTPVLRPVAPPAAAPAKSETGPGTPAGTSGIPSRRETGELP